MKVCKSCDRVLGPKNKSGFCKHHFAAFIANDPEWKRKRAEGLRRKFNDPEHRAKMAKVVTRNSQKYYAGEEAHARAVERGKWLYKTYLNRPDIRERNRRSVSAAGKKISEAKIGWCPVEFRERYYYLTRTKRMLAADAREVVEREIADKEALRDVDSALTWLRRLAPVQKLKDGYRVGFSDVLSPSEVIRRAELQGWEPERWAA